MTVSGIPISSELLDFSKTENFDYTGLLNKSLKGDEGALQSLFLFCEKTKEGNEAAHRQVLINLFKSLGDEKISQAVAKMDEVGRMEFLADMEHGETVYLKEFAPVTWNSLFSKKEILEQRGLYVFSRQANDMYQICGNQNGKYVAIDMTGAIERNYLRLLRKPYPGQAFFAELKGFITAKYGKQELPTNSSGFFVVTEILDLEAKNYRNTCVPYELWAMGEDWQLQVSSTEELFELKIADRDRYVYFPFSQPMKTDTATVYESVNDKTGDNIRVVVKGEGCKIEMPGVPFTQEVTIIVNNKSFKGCGFPLEADSNEK